MTTSHTPVRPHATRTSTDLWLFAVVTLLLSWVPLAVAIAQGRTSGVWFVVGTSGPTLAALLLWLGRRRRPRGLARPVLTRAWAPSAVVLGLLPSAAAVALADPAFARSTPAAMITGAGGL